MDASLGKDGYSITIADAPWSPWLRLAHTWRHQVTEASGNTGKQRRLFDFEFFLQLDGEGWLELPEVPGRVLVPAGSLALIPPGLLHAWGGRNGTHVAVHFDLQADPTMSMQEMMLWTDDPGGMPPIIPPPTIIVHCAGARLHWPLVRPLVDPGSWRSRFNPLLALDAQGSQSRPADRLLAAGILASAVSDFIRSEATPAGNRMEALLTKIAGEDVPERHRIAELAEQAGMCETAFRAAVRARTGLSPKIWLERRRMERAAMYLAVHRLSVHETARRCGYDDPFHFSRAFRRVHGRAPSTLRFSPGSVPR